MIKAYITYPDGSTSERVICGYYGFECYPAYKHDAHMAGKEVVLLGSGASKGLKKDCARPSSIHIMGNCEYMFPGLQEMLRSLVFSGYSKAVHPLSVIGVTASDELIRIMCVTDNKIVNRLKYGREVSDGKCSK